MLDVIKYQKDVLGDPNFRRYQQDGKNVYISADGVVVVAIPKSAFFLSLEKLEEAGTETINFADIFRTREGIELELTGIMKQLKSGVAVELAFDRTSYWLDSKKFKPFSKRYNYIGKDSYVKMVNMDNGQIEAVIMKIDMQ